MKTFDALFAELSERARTRPAGSGTVAALDGGVHGIGKKILEEAGEVWLAAEHESDDALADHLATAGTAAGEPVWRLPIVEEYSDRINSKVADSDNAGGSPGAITAALFLRAFTGSVPWAHLDIASVGDAAKDADEWTSGPTGFGPRLLLDWLAGRDGRVTGF